MLSTDLPVTDWWDPEWDVYDVPIAPDNVPHIVWWEAYYHLAMIEYITTGRTWGWPDGILTRQLTTGHDPLCPAITAGWECDCRDEGPSPYLGRWPWPCSCAYIYLCCGLIADSVDGVQFLKEFGYDVGHSATGFIIHSDCPQHGDDAHV